MDAQKQVMQGLWRKAGKLPEGLEIKCKSLSDARKLRFALYNAVREFKPDKAGMEPRARADGELQAAIDACSLGYKENEPLTLVIRQKSSSAMMQAALSALGGERLLTEEEREAKASEESVLKKLAAMGVSPDGTGGDGEASATAPRVTPYYTR